MAGARRSPSPGQQSDGSDSPSAPGEYLAEFMAAVMRRQYARALTYCGLILQHEPHNATARGLYPVLQRKLALTEQAPASGDSSWSSDSDSEWRWSPEMSPELRWEGSSSSSPRSERSADLNGNQPAPAADSARADHDNDNLPLNDNALRAHFACST